MAYQIKRCLIGLLVIAYVYSQAVTALHAATHLTPDRITPHPAACIGCVLAVETGGAPLLETLEFFELPRHHEIPVRSLVLRRSENGAPTYRSRAPPVAV